MIVILEKGSILWRCQSPYHHRWQPCHLRVSPFLLPTFHQISTLEKDNFVVNVPFWVVWWASPHHKSLCSCLLLIQRAQKYFLPLRFGFPRAFPMQSRQARSDLTLKFIIGFDFAVTLSSPASSCVLFDIASRLFMELIWLMLNKHKRWFHSSRVKVPFVNLYASWFLMSIYLIWILGSKLILSNNQSRATLWVLETCLIAGLLPFMIILITASLSSKIYNKASLREECTFEEINQHRLDHQPFQEISFALKICAGWHELSSCTGVPFLITLIRVSVKNCDDQIPFIKRGYTVQP